MLSTAFQSWFPVSECVSVSSIQRSSGFGMFGVVHGMFQGRRLMAMPRLGHVGALHHRPPTAYQTHQGARQLY